MAADHLVTGRPFESEERARAYMRALWSRLVANGGDVQWSVFTVGRCVWMHRRTDEERLAYLWNRDTLLPAHRARHDQQARGP